MSDVDGNGEIEFALFQGSKGQAYNEEGMFAFFKEGEEDGTKAKPPASSQKPALNEYLAEDQHHRYLESRGWRTWSLNAGDDKASENETEAHKQQSSGGIRSSAEEKEECSEAAIAGVRYVEVVRRDIGVTETEAGFNGNCLVSEED